MKFRLLPALTFFLIVLTSGLAFAEDKAALYQELKLWSFKAVSAGLTFQYDNYEERLKENVGLFTEDGCKSYMRTMLDFGISDGVAKRKEVLSVKDIWSYKVPRDFYNQITVSDEEKTREGYFRWRVKVPLVITFSHGMRKKDYRFFAYLKVHQVPELSGKFKIDAWYPYTERGSMEPRNYKPKRSVKDYTLCKSLYP